MSLELATPAILVDEPVLANNIGSMQTRADQLGWWLRPHFKTHKMPAIAQRQLDEGACGLAVATLSEARVMLEAGFKDIQVANQVIHPSALREFRSLHHQVTITCAVDSYEGVRRLNRALEGCQKPASVLIEVNTGLNRAGVASVDEALALSHFIQEQPHVKLTGLMTHGGQSYGADHPSVLQAQAQHEKAQIEHIAQTFQAEGFKLDTVSIGATPLTPYLASSEMINELRVGNYVFYDRSQVALGTTHEGHCALTVLTTVISKPQAGRAIVDAGSKALTTDQGAHGHGKLQGFGEVVGKSANVSKVSEEHGIVHYDPLSTDFQVGELIEIIPNHACPVVNLFDQAFLIQHGEVIGQYQVTASGYRT
jgi:D-serine deaminase-like pyridoxal phosphate-dependent protein